MKNKIPTAENFLQKNSFEIYNENSNFGNNMDKVILLSDAIDLCKKFAKLHIDACKEEIANNAKTKSDWYQSNDCPDGFSYEVVDRDSILNAYPKTNIK